MSELIESAAESDAPQHRRIRSFVVRAGRMSPKQIRGVDEGMLRFGLIYSPEPIHLSAAFGRSAPCVLEIGFGMGVTTAEIATAQPDTDFLAIEVHPPGVGNLCNLLSERQLSNVRVMQHDAVEVLTHMIAPNSLSGIHIYFPDPWHKKRHNKRRLVQPDLTTLLASRLSVGGYLHLATDWVPYAEHMLEVLSAEPMLKNSASDYSARPSWRPETKFERRGLKLGHEVRDLLFLRV
ncbi:MAG: tRNA (guanosine(46)-N7)-methyltransferase TrmB [Betaproteobacteria bacterium]|nr:MAG: tRNA (guanosine(46)-N7)-methyltransferase TrmB [Betaproteobacteria bacterium]